MWLAIAASLQKMTVAPALAALPLCIISAKRHTHTSGAGTVGPCFPQSVACRVRTLRKMVEKPEPSAAVKPEPIDALSASGFGRRSVCRSAGQVDRRTRWGHWFEKISSSSISSSKELGRWSGVLLV